MSIWDFLKLGGAIFWFMSMVCFITLLPWVLVVLSVVVLVKIFVRKRAVAAQGNSLVLTDRVARSPSPTVGWIVLITIMILVLVGFGEDARQSGKSIWRAYSFAFVKSFGLILAALSIFLVLTRAGRKLIYSISALLLRMSESIDFRAASKATTASSRISKYDRLTVWSDNPEDADAFIRDIFERTTRCFVDYTGFPEPEPQPLRVLCFQNRSTMLKYGRAWSQEFLGFYMARPVKRIVLCCDWADTFPSSFSEVVAHEYTHHLLRIILGRTPPMWLGEGLCMRVSRLVAPRADVCPAARIRWLQAARARGTCLSGDTLIRMNYLGFHKLMRNSQKTGVDLATAVYIQGQMLVTQLSEIHGEVFHKADSTLKRNTGENERDIA